MSYDYFIDALDDPDMALKVRERASKSLGESLQIALRLEAWAKDARRQSSEAQVRKPPERSVARSIESSVKSDGSKNEERLAMVLEGLTECLSGLRSSWCSEPPNSQNSGEGKEVNEVNFTLKYPWTPKVTKVPQNTECYRCRRPGHF